MSKFKAFFSTMEDSLANSDRPLDAELLYRIRAFQNALYEAITDKPASGSGTQSVKGHDHTKTGISPYYGGARLHRNQVYIASSGITGTLYNGTVATAGVYVNADNGWSAAQSRNGNSLPLITAYVSHDWDTGGGGVPTNPPYLSGWIKLENFTPVLHTQTLSIKVYNQTLTRYSATSVYTTISASAQNAWIELDKIPCASGWNDFNIEVTSSQSGQDFEFTKLVFFEEAENGPSAGGTSPLGVPVK